MTMAPELTDTAWGAQLTRLEADVEAVEALLADPTMETYDPEAVAGWTPPTELGEVPEELLPRARAVLARQRAVAEALTGALAANARQRGFAARVNDATVAPPAPAYLDVTA